MKEWFDEIIELTDQINLDDLIYYFRKESSRKRFDEFENGINLFEKIKSGDEKLEEAKKYKKVFKSTLKEIARGRYKSKVQNSALQNIKMFYKAREPTIKLFNDYYTIASEASNPSKTMSLLT